MGIGGIAAIVARTPVGALVDRTTAKRALIVAGAITVTAGTLAMPLFPHFYAISLLQALTGLAGSVFAPALAAITLGIVGPRSFSRRVGRNESFNHAGNAAAGAVTGGLAYHFGPAVVFWVLAAMAALSVVATLRIPREAIDHDMARGIDHMPGDADIQPSGFAVLLRDRSADLRCDHVRVSPGQRRHAAAGRTGSRTTEQGRRHRFDGDVRGGRADRDGADGIPRRCQGRQLGTKADLSGWIRLLNASWLPLHTVRQLLLAGRRADPGRRRCRNLRRVVPARCARPDARHRAFQRHALVR